MKKFFQDIFEYHHHYNQKLLTQLIEVKERLPARTFPLFSHSLNAHQIWNARITTREELGVHQNHGPEDCRRIDSENLKDTQQILEERNLEEVITYRTSKGMVFSNSVQDILFHVANHFTHHRGQIISDIRQSGYDPIITDYIFYKR